MESTRQGKSSSDMPAEIKLAVLFENPDRFNKMQIAEMDAFLSALNQELLRKTPASAKKIHPDLLFELIKAPFIGRCARFIARLPFDDLKLIIQANIFKDNWVIHVDLLCIFQNIHLEADKLHLLKFIILNKSFRCDPYFLEILCNYRAVPFIKLHFAPDEQEQYDALMDHLLESALKNQRYHPLLASFLNLASLLLIKKIIHIDKLTVIVSHIGFAETVRLLAAPLEKHPLFLTNSEMIETLLPFAMNFMTSAVQIKPFQNCLALLFCHTDVSGKKQILAWLADHLSALFQKLLRFESTLDAPMLCDFLVQTNILLQKNPEEKTADENACHPLLLLQLKKSSLLNSCIDFIDTLPASQIQLLLDKEDCTTQLAVIEKITSLAKQGMLFQFFINQPQNLTFFNSLPEKTKKQLSHRFRATLTSDNNAKNKEKNMLRTIPQEDALLDSILENPLRLSQDQRDQYVNPTKPGKRNVLQYGLGHPHHHDKIVPLLDKISQKALRSECVFSILSSHDGFFYLHFSSGQNNELLMRLIDSDDDEQGLLDYCIRLGLRNMVMALLAVSRADQISLLIKNNRLEKILQRLPFADINELIKKFLLETSCKTVNNLDSLLKQIITGRQFWVNYIAFFETLGSKKIKIPPAILAEITLKNLPLIFQALENHIKEIKSLDFEKFLFFINAIILQADSKRTTDPVCHQNLLDHLKLFSFLGLGAKFIATLPVNQIKEIFESARDSSENVIAFLNLPCIFKHLKTTEDKQSLFKCMLTRPHLMANTEFLDILLDQHATLFKNLTFTTEEQDKYDLLIFPYTFADVPNLVNLIMSHKKYYPLLEPLLRLASKDKFIPEILPKVIDTLARLESALPESDMCNHLININQLLRGYPEEKTDDIKCHAALLSELGKLSFLNGCMGFINLLPAPEIQAFLDNRDFDQQLNIIKNLSSPLKKCQLLAAFFDRMKNSAFFYSLTLDSQKTLLGDIITTLQSENPAKNTCFGKLKEYVQNTCTAENLHKVVKALVLLTSNEKSDSEILALARSAQSNSQGKISIDPLAGILQTYLNNANKPSPAPATASSRRYGRASVPS